MTIGQINGANKKLCLNLTEFLGSSGLSLWRRFYKWGNIVIKKCLNTIHVNVRSNDVKETTLLDFCRVVGQRFCGAKRSERSAGRLASMRRSSFTKAATIAQVLSPDIFIHHLIFNGLQLSWHLYSSPFNKLWHFFLVLSSLSSFVRRKIAEILRRG